MFWPGGEETSATGEVQPDGNPVLQVRSVQSLLRVIIFASGDLSESTPSLILRWRRRWRASSTLGPLPGADPSSPTCFALLAGLLAVSFLLLGAGAPLALETLQSLDPPLTS